MKELNETCRDLELEAFSIVRAKDLIALVPMGKWSTRLDYIENLYLLQHLSTAISISREGL